MVVHSEKSTWLIFLIMCLPLLGAAAEETQMEQTTINATEIEPNPNTNTTKDLYASETADPKKVDIVKQIRRLNEDGSYTVGYEAGDGTFKIESRDVQGNIKGTFGYVDQDGEIKRVSYSTSNTSQSSLLVPVQTVQPVQTGRVNRTSASTTRRPQPTLIYPKTSSVPTKPTVIQAIPRRRPVNTVSNLPAVTTTESYRVVTGNSVNLTTLDSSTDSSQSKNVKQFPIFTTRTSSDAIKAALTNTDAFTNDQKIYQEINRLSVDVNNNTSSTTPKYLRSSLVFEKISEKPKEAKPVRANTFRRQLSSTNYENGPMYAFQQSAGDDMTDVYGGSIALGTPRPLFTTTTGRPRLIPIQSILGSRHKLNEKLADNNPQVHEEQQETTLEATTNKIDDEKFVTSNPIPVIQYPGPPENLEQRVIERPYLRHYPPVPQVAQFRTREFLRDNPGAPIPIGNQRVLFRYNPNILVDGNGQIIRQNVQPVTPPNIVHVANRPPIQNIENPNEVGQDKPNIIAIPIYQGNPQIPRYQMQPHYNERENIVPQQRIPVLPPTPPMGDLPSITAPVSTRDLKLLLQQLLVRQNRLQTLIDIREGFIPPGPLYQNPQFIPQHQAFDPDYRQKTGYGPRSAYPPQYSEARQYNSFIPQPPYNPYQQQNYQNQQNQYPRNDYQPQDDRYRNEVSNFDPAIPYESQRFIPRRRFYAPRQYDPRYEDGNGGNENEDQVEYLPPDVREALLLKMLMLAIHPDFNPMSQDPQAGMTTPLPEYRKKVRNVQILGEETETKENEAKREKRML